jgi:hypothetical protein
MNLYENSIKFRVAAAIDTEPGVYYVDWKITEDPLVENTPLYHAPVKTMIEVKQNQLISV